MPIYYYDLKKEIINLIDDESVNYDVVEGYGKDFNKNTLLNDIGLTPSVRAGMPKKLNKLMRKLIGNSWRIVGPIDLIEISTIGDFIRLVCGQSGIALPAGEPS